MKHYIGFILFLALLSGVVGLVANVLGDEYTYDFYEESYLEDQSYAASIDTDLEELRPTLHVLGEPFDLPMREEDISRIETVLSNPDLKEWERYSLGDIEMMFNGKPTTLTLETEAEIEDGNPYFTIFMMGDPEVIETLDEHIDAYYEELGI